MAFTAAARLEKPVKHLSLAQWNLRVTQIRNQADARRNNSFNIRHNARTLRNETRIEGDWSNGDTNETLTDRVKELEVWRNIIAATFKRIENEVKLLDEEKSATERELSAIQTPISVVTECLSMRDGRLGSEITYDDADKELKKELSVLEGNQRILAEQCHIAWRKLSRLEEVKFKLGLEIENKTEAIELDIGQLKLDKFSTNITNKTKPTRNPKNSCSYKSWLENTQNMKKLADIELADTFTIRESLYVVREKARNQLLGQQDRTEHTIRKRVFETQRARNELEWQKLKMREEMAKAMHEMKVLEKTLAEKTDALKLAETRLENRAQRSGKELCLDMAHDQLCREVTQLRDISRRIQAKIDKSKKSYNILEDQQHKINEDLDNKQHSLMTDIRAIDLRQRLKGSEFGQAASAGGEFDRGIIFTHMEQEIPKHYTVR